jgi:hypothetical protein
MNFSMKPGIFNYSRCALLTSLICLNLLSAPAIAQSRSLEGHVCLNPGAQIMQTFFGDLNQLIEDQDCGFITREPNEALNQIFCALALGLEVEYGLADDILLGVSYSSFFPFTEIRIGSWLTPDRVYGIYLDADQFGLGARKVWWQGESFLLYASAELLYVRLTRARESYKERIIFTSMRTVESLRYRGQTVGCKVSGGLDLFIFGWLSLNSELGFRYACIGEVKGVQDDGTESTLHNPDGSNFTLDYSGVFIKGGIRFWL